MGVCSGWFLFKILSIITEYKFPKVLRIVHPRRRSGILGGGQNTKDLGMVNWIPSCLLPESFTHSMYYPYLSIVGQSLDSTYMEYRCKMGCQILFLFATGNKFWVSLLTNCWPWVQVTIYTYLKCYILHVLDIWPKSRTPHKKFFNKGMYVLVH